MIANTKKDRDAIGPDEVLCDHCTAKCCKYFALPIETPVDLEDYEFIRWYLVHDRATVFTDDDQWYIMIHTTCRHLQTDNRCGIYDTRPQICRDYTTDNCEYEDHWTYDLYFENPEQIRQYTEAVLQLKTTGSIRSPKPNLLPVLS
ncbi:MAG: YkgJ family cysteine cluster protein [Planctomycetaceae bacterium]|jgi:uncharacterized protein|nr:YkgJ family cysteine cluster protein [Planctomycetaceae bacterium]MBT4013934.1 YkgJ family cysteine cluster protein [Planctomycetaceae bacterium]MBT4726047.1 YkgJ family cysteine cluster protein [Planctomycetaceae bacterium]MBT4846443.1 YkgJ family cysteine cluster protein [Planctomycetaceae bacterium]MBT5124423.1 YkgJ family cysteine cluster protein [Planctomycetaceae bacterium]